jgi:hypothetical protein
MIKADCANHDQAMYVAFKAEDLFATSWLPDNRNIGYSAVTREQNTCLLIIKTKGRS